MGRAYQNRKESMAKTADAKTKVTANTLVRSMSLPSLVASTRRVI